MTVDDPTNIILPLVEERLHVGKRAIETDHVRVRTVVDERQVSVEDIVARGELSVEHVAIGREVAEAPLPRQEGDVFVVPIVEERLVIEKRLFLVEELHVRQTVTQHAVSIPTTIRSMRAVVERDGDQSTTGEK